jgi:aryl-alcohol dehydrogenase-like predicted oxidoreductase
MTLEHRLALGTVQFGRPYGVANQLGQISQTAITSILDYASSVKINTLDTAIAYGKSEQRLGDFGVTSWNVVTKLPALPESCNDVVGFVKHSVERSLNRLKLNCLHGLLLHHPEQLLGVHGEQIYQTIVALKEAGKINKIGLSIYGPEALDALWPRYHFDLVQAPFNICDRRLLTSGWLNRLKRANTEVHVRSIFLQGLLLMPKEKRPVIFNRWQPLWDAWELWLKEQALTPLQACLNFALANAEIDRVLVGVDSLEHLQEIIASTNTSFVLPPDSLVSTNLDLINPARWNVL